MRGTTIIGTGSRSIFAAVELRNSRRGCATTGSDNRESAGFPAQVGHGVLDAVALADDHLGVHVGERGSAPGWST